MLKNHQRPIFSFGHETRHFGLNVKRVMNSNRVLVAVNHPWHKNNNSTNDEQTIQVKQILKDRLYNSIAQSIIEIVKTPHLSIKIFLILAIFISSAITALLIIQSFLDYYKYDVTKTTRTIFDMPSLFPKVTICQSSPFTTLYSLVFLKEINTGFDIFNTSQMIQLSSIEEKYEKVWRLYLLATAKMNDRRVSDETRKLLGHQLDDILLSCKYNNQKCTSKDFVCKFDSLFGNCFVFNSGFNSSGHRVESRVSSIPGDMFGLKLAFYNNYHESLSAFNSIFPRGAQIRIENNSYQSYETNFDDIFVAPGFATSISMERSFDYLKAKPFSNCDIDNNSPKTFNSDLYKQIVHASSFEYTQNFCFFQCYQRELIKICNCSDPWFASIIDKSPCVTNEETDCLVNIYNGVFLSSDFIKTECVPQCPLECSRKEFKYSISNQLIDNWYYNEKLMANRNFTLDIMSRNSSLKESVIAVNVYYNSLTYNLSTESQLRDIVSLLAYIGGIVSLFLGVSFFSIFELVEFLIEVYFIKKTKDAMTLKNYLS